MRQTSPFEAPKPPGFFYTALKEAGRLTLFLTKFAVKRALFLPVYAFAGPKTQSWVRTALGLRYAFTKFLNPMRGVYHPQAYLQQNALAKRYQLTEERQKERAADQKHSVMARQAEYARTHNPAEKPQAHTQKMTTEIVLDDGTKFGQKVRGHTKIELATFKDEGGEQILLPTRPARHSFTVPDQYVGKGRLKDLDPTTLTKRAMHRGKGAIQQQARLASYMMRGARGAVA